MSIRNVVVENGGRTGCSVTGIPGYPVRNVSLENMIINLKGGVKVSKVGRVVPELMDQYPEATMFGILPAGLLYMRHVDSISLTGMVVNFEENDARDHLVAEDVTGLDYDQLQVNGSEEITLQIKQQ